MGFGRENNVLTGEKGCNNRNEARTRAARRETKKNSVRMVGQQQLIIEKLDKLRQKASEWTEESPSTIELSEKEKKKAQGKVRYAYSGTGGKKKGTVYTKEKIGGKKNGHSSFSLKFTEENTNAKSQGKESQSFLQEERGTAARQRQ